MPSADVIANVRATGVPQFRKDMGQVTGATEEAGQATEATAATNVKQGATSFLKTAAAVGVLYKGYQGIKGAIDTTSELAKNTAAFSRASGLDAKQSQSWVLVAEQRGIETEQLQIGMATLGRNLGALGGSTKASSAMFDQLGLSQTKLLKMPMEQRMAAIADAFKKLPDGTVKAALAQRVFGRSGTQLLPILDEGGKSMKEQLDSANKLVPALGGTGKGALKLAAQQREMNDAMIGLKVVVGSTLIPILLTLVKTFTPIVAVIVELLRTVPGLSDAIVVLVGALTAMLIINRISDAIVGLGLAEEGLSIATLGWIGLIIGIVAALIIAYNKISWFHNAVDAIWNAIKTVAETVINFIKDHWKLLAIMVATILLGPIAGLVAAFFLLRDKVHIVTDAIKAAFTAVKTWIGGEVKAIVGFFASLPNQIVAFFTALPKRIASALSGLGHIIASAFKAAFSSVEAIVKASLNAVIAAWNGLHFTVGAVKVLGKQIFGGVTVRVPQIPQLAGGGTIAQGGLSWVGEKGPELLSLPRGAQVTPLTAPSLSLAGGGQTRPIVVQTFLGRRQIGQAIASYTEELQAAR